MTAVAEPTVTASGKSQVVHSDSLKITEVFQSVQGESSLAGWPTVFIRLTGCPLRCQYCDTAYAFHGGQRQSLQELLQQVASYQTRHVCVTGGEPLAQKACLPLLARLCDNGHVVSLETSGALSVAEVDVRVIKILDIKTPGSAEVQRNHWQNLQHLQAHDEIKFVICDRADYLWAKARIAEHGLSAWQLWMSPSHQQLPAEQLAGWILQDRLSVRLQLQLHKYIWGDQPGR